MLNFLRQRILWRTLVGFDIFLSLGGFVGGISFISDSTGSGLGAQVSWLERSPVDNFLLPGIYILVMYALAPLVSLVLIRVGKTQVLLVNAAIGFSLIPWIAYQFVVVPDTIFVQYIMLFVGSIIAATSLWLYKQYRDINL